MTLEKSTLSIACCPMLSRPTIVAVCISSLAVIQFTGCDQGFRGTIDAEGARYTHVFFLPGGRKLASWEPHADKLFIWDLKTCELERACTWDNMPRHSAYFNVVSPSGALLALVTPGEDDERVLLAVWDIATMSVQWQTSIGAQCFPPTFSQDGKLLACSQEDKSVVTVLVWDARTGQLETKLEGPDSVGRDLLFSPNRETLSGLDRKDERILVWSLRTGHLQYILEAGHDSISHMRYVKDNTTLCAVTPNTLVHWDLRTGKERLRLELPGDTDAIWLVLSDGSFLAKSETNVLARWLPRPNGLEEVWTVQLLKPGPVPRSIDGEPITMDRFVDFHVLLASPDERYFVFTATTGEVAYRKVEKGTVKYWTDEGGYNRCFEIATGRIGFDGPGAFPIMFSPDGNTLVLKSQRELRLVPTASLIE